MEFTRNRQQHTLGSLFLTVLCAVGLWLGSAVVAEAALDAQWINTGLPGTTANKQSVSVSSYCGAGWSSGYIADDNQNGVQHIGEEDTDGGIAQLCLRSTTPGVTVSAGWYLYGCPAGMTDSGVRDDLDQSHTTNEEDFQPNGSDDYVWCLGASNPSGTASIAVNWTWWASDTKGPPCGAGEVRLLYGKSGKRNLNSEDSAGSNQESLCAKIVEPPTIDITVNGSNGPITVAGNSNVSLAWTTSGDPATCTASGAWSGDKAAGGGSENQNVGTTQKTYTVTCSNGAGNHTDQVTVMIAPSVDLKVNSSDGPITVSYGSSLSLNWTSQNTSSCTLAGAGIALGGVAVNGSRSVTATASGDYVLSCNGVTDYVTVNVTIPTPVPSCSASPTTITSGQSVTWTASATGGNGTYTYSWTGTDSLTGSNANVSKTYSTTGTKTGRVTVTSGGQSASADCSSSVTVNSPPVSVDLKVNGSDGPITINQNTNFTLTWTTTGNPASCTASGSWSGAKTVSGGSETQNTGTTNKTYTITCGSVSDTVTVNVGVQLTILSVDLKVNNSDGPYSALSNTNITLTWTTTGNPASCTASGSWSGAKTVSGGSETQNTGTTNKTYTITCTTASGSATDSVTVTNSGTMTKPVASFTSVPATCTVGQPYTVRFKSVDAEGESVAFDYSWNWGASPAQGVNGHAPNTPNNTDASYTYTYTAAGTYQIAVRASDRLIGDFVYATVTCTAAAAVTPYVTFEGRVNSGTYSTANRSINSGDQVEFRWASNMTSCTSYSGIAGVSGPSGGPVAVTEPAAGSSQTYSVTCNTGATTITKDITVSTNAVEPQPTGLSLTLGSTENGIGDEISNPRDVGTGSILGIYWYANGSDECYYTWWGVFRGTSVNSGLGQVPRSPGSGSDTLFPPPRNIGDYLTARVSCLDSTRTQEVVKTVTLRTTYAGNEPPMPSVSLQARKVSGAVTGGWTSGTLNILSGDRAHLQWSSSNADSCTGSGAGFTTPSLNGTDLDIIEPGAGRSSTYSISCVNSFGSAPASITLNNTTPNTPPTAPTVTGPTTGYSGTSYQFAIASSTDANGDRIRYEVDWNNNGVLDQASSYFSPTPTSVYRPSYPWSTAGTKTFCVWAYDGIAASAKTCHTITLTAPPPPIVDVKVNDSDGPVNVKRGDDMTVSWNIQNYAGPCTLYGAEVNPTQWWNSGQRSVSGTGSITIDTSDSSFNSITSEDYFLQCGSYDDTATVNLTSMYLTYEIRENAGAWSPNNITVPAGSPLELHWNYTHPQATNCTSVDFATGNRIKSTNFDSNGGVSVGTLTAGQSKSFTIRCNTWSGFTTATIVATAHRPNFTTPIVNTPVLGTFSTTTNKYNTVSFTFRTENDGGSAVPAPPPTADYRFEFDNDVNCSSGCTYETVYNRTNALEALASGAGTNKTEQVSNVTAGVHRVRITVDSGSEVIENNETDNVYTGTVTIPMQDPGVSITTNRPQVRKDDTATITWTITNPNPTLSCVVSGPGLTPQTYTASGNLTTPPITAKSEYSLRCTDSSTGTIWQRSVSVETTGTVEEI